MSWLEEHRPNEHLIIHVLRWTEDTFTIEDFRSDLLWIQKRGIVPRILLISNAGRQRRCLTNVQIKGALTKFARNEVTGVPLNSVETTYKFKENAG